MLWGYAAAGQQGGPLVAAATKALAGAADISAKELGQVGGGGGADCVEWALAVLKMSLLLSAVVTNMSATFAYCALHTCRV